MGSRRFHPVVLGALTVLLLLLGTAAPVIASPAPVSGCPPCSDGFTRSAANHDLDTDVQHSEATVHVHENGSATWTVHVVPTNETVLSKFEENQSLARAVAADSFGGRYGGEIDHDLISVEVAEGGFVIRYRTLGVVSEGPFNTQVLTYFRNSPGAYVYTDLGADELTVIAPPGMTIARGFGSVTGDRMTANELPDVQDGPFVVFVPEQSAVPGLYGTLAVLEILWGVVARNLVYFVALPGGVLIGGFGGIRRLINPSRNWSTTRLGSLVASGGALLLVGTVISEGDSLPAVTGNFLLGGFGGALLLALGVSVAAERIRRYLTPLRLVGTSIAVAIAALVLTGGLIGSSNFQRSLSMAAALLPVAVSLGWMDALHMPQDRSPGNRLYLGLSVAIIGFLVASAPLTALGGTLFLLAPILLTVASVAVVIVALPLYLLGAAGANAELP